MLKFIHPRNNMQCILHSQYISSSVHSSQHWYIKAFCFQIGTRSVTILTNIWGSVLSFLWQVRFTRQCYLSCHISCLGPVFNFQVIVVRDRADTLFVSYTCKPHEQQRILSPHSKLSAKVMCRVDAINFEVTLAFTWNVCFPPACSFNF